MPKPAIPKNQDRNQARDQPMHQQLELQEQRRDRMVQQRDTSLNANFNFVQGIYDRLDSLEQSLNTKMEKLQQSFDDSVKSIQDIVVAKQLQEKVKKHDRLYTAVVTACNDS